MSNQKISPWEYTYNVTNVKQHKPSKENLIVEFYSNDTLLCINFQTVGTADKHDRSLSCFRIIHLQAHGFQVASVFQVATQSIRLGIRKPRP